MAGNIILADYGLIVVIGGNCGASGSPNRPVIGTCNSRSELNHCKLHLRAGAEEGKRGVWAAGGFALEFPTIRLGEI